VTDHPLHIVFAPAAAAELRNALREAGREVRVVALFDNLAYGPINPPDPIARQNWIETQLGYRGFETIFAEAEVFWRQALVEQDRKIAWISRRSAPEYTGFLEWLWRLDDLPCEVVDLTDMSLPGGRRGEPPTPPQPMLSLALLASHHVLDNGLIDRAEPLAPAARKHYRALWQRLRAENAPLRVLTADGLISAPITFLDSLLLSCASTNWQKTARVVGEALSKELDDMLLQAGDLVLFPRLRALVGGGLLEGRGDLFDVHQSYVRLPNGATNMDAV
jgi:hypothetical protein